MGPVVELGVGTGRIAVPTALAGVRVIGVDSSARDARGVPAAGRGGGRRRTCSTCGSGDYSAPPVTERVRLVTCPFRAYLHLQTDEERLGALRAALDAPRAGRPSRVRRLRPEPRGHPRTRTGAGSSGSPGSGSAPTGTRKRRRLDLSVRGEDGRDDDAPRLAPAGALAGAARRGRLRGDRGVRLVRPQARTGAARTRCSSASGRERQERLPVGHEVAGREPLIRRRQLSRSRSRPRLIVQMWS